MKSKRAFSLIELSIVIMIVGILIAGVTQGYSLLGKMKLASARSITQGSPAISIYGLALWLDATSEKAFSPNLSNQDPVSRWNDSNPQQSSKSDAVAVAAAPNFAQMPNYVSRGINGLPTLRCDGSNNSILSITPNSNYFSDVTPTITNNFTIFLVAQATEAHEIDTQSDTGVGGTSGQKYILGATQGGSQYGDDTIAGMGVSFGTNGISIYEHSSFYMPSVLTYEATLSAPIIITINYSEKVPTILINGSLVKTGSPSLKNLVFPSVTLCSGQYGAFTGDIGEIIVYSKEVNASKRKQIEKYLGKKWGIKVS
ncbi:MAG: type II secretion system GspH family protein [Proteobacteria bacterium]|nr:type II secretion system GspH family protein [Pseudomonadota bacterium]